MKRRSKSTAHYPVPGCAGHSALAASVAEPTVKPKRKLLQRKVKPWWQKMMTKGFQVSINNASAEELAPRDEWRWQKQAIVSYREKYGPFKHWRSKRVPRDRTLVERNHVINPGYIVAIFCQTEGHQLWPLYSS